MPLVRRKTIALIFAGGSVLSQKPRAWERVRRASDMERWLENLPELRVIADLQPSFVVGDGVVTECKDWIALGERIKTLLPAVDGVLVLHGLDSLHYASNALSLMVQSLPVPVVFTASPFRTGAPKRHMAEFGARANIVNAAQVAVADLAEVCVVYGNRIMRGSRMTIGQHGTEYQPVAFDQSVLGRIDFGTTLDGGRIRRAARRARFELRLDPEVFVLPSSFGSLTPLRKAVDDGIHAVLVSASDDVVGLPAALNTELVRAVQRKVPVVVASQKPLTLHPLLVSLAGTSPSMAIIKTMWARGITADRTRFRSLLERAIAGEFIGKGRP